MKREIVGVLAAFACTTAMSADPFGGSSVQAGWSGLNFMLQDLTPSDGIAPTLIATGARDYGFDFGLCHPVSERLGVVPPDYRPRTFVSQNFGVGPSLNSNSGHGCFGDITSFQLSPNAKVTITGDIFVNSSGPSFATRLRDNQLFSFDMAAWGDSSVAFKAGLINEGDSVSSANGRVAHPFRFVLETSSNPADFSLEFDEAVFGRNSYSITAVPEPETYALMLAGLGALGVVARRRRNG